MRKLWILAGIILVLIGVGGLAAYGWETDNDLEPLEKKWSFDAQSLHSLRIKSDYNIDIKFVRSTDGTNSIALKGEGKKKMIEDTLATEIENGVLSLDLREKPTRWLNFFNFNIRRANEELTISIAEGAKLDTLRVDMDSANVSLKDAALIDLGEANIDLDSGNVSIDNFKADRLIVSADSGNVTANGITAAVKIDTDSGNMRLTDVAGPTELEVESGNIRLYKLTGDDTSIEADSGNVYVQVPSGFGGFYDVQVDSGSVKYPDSKRETTEYIKVRADSGNVTIEEK